MEKIDGGNDGKERNRKRGGRGWAKQSSPFLVIHRRQNVLIEKIFDGEIGQVILHLKPRRGVGGSGQDSAMEGGTPPVGVGGSRGTQK